MEKQHEVSKEVKKEQGDILTISGMAGTPGVLLVQSTAKSCGLKVAALQEAQAFKLQVGLCGGYEGCYNRHCSAWRWKLFKTLCLRLKETSGGQWHSSRFMRNE